MKLLKTAEPFRANWKDEVSGSCGQLMSSTVRLPELVHLTVPECIVHSVPLPHGMACKMPSLSRTSEQYSLSKLPLEEKGRKK